MEKKEALQQGIDKYKHYVKLFKEMTLSLSRVEAKHYFSTIYNINEAVLDIRGDVCALCEKYAYLRHYKGSERCTECPVTLKTGYPHCRHTPWKWIELYIIFCINNSDPISLKALVLLLQAEVDFLESLKNGDY